MKYEKGNKITCTNPSTQEYQVIIIHDVYGDRYSVSVYWYLPNGSTYLYSSTTYDDEDIQGLIDVSKRSGMTQINIASRSNTIDKSKTSLWPILIIAGVGIYFLARR